MTFSIIIKIEILFILFTNIYKNKMPNCNLCKMAGHSEDKCKTFIICNFCDKQGHRSSDCWLKKKPCEYCKTINRSPQIYFSHLTSNCRDFYCNTCGEKGHFTDKCVKTPCETCGKYNHTTQNCFKNIKDCTHCRNLNSFYKEKNIKKIIPLFIIKNHDLNDCPNICHHCYNYDSSNNRYLTHVNMFCKLKIKYDKENIYSSTIKSTEVTNLENSVEIIENDCLENETEEISSNVTSSVTSSVTNVVTNIVSNVVPENITELHIIEENISKKTIVCEDEFTQTETQNEPKNIALAFSQEIELLRDLACVLQEIN